MRSLFSLARQSGRERHSGPRKRLASRPGLEALEDRNLLSFWTGMASMNVARAELAGAAGSDSQMYAIGGVDSSFTALSSVEAYNSSLNTWSLKAPMPIAPAAPGAAQDADTRIYAISGATAFAF